MKIIIAVAAILVIGFYTGLLLSINNSISNNSYIQQQYLKHSDSLCRVIAVKDSVLELRKDLINGCVEFFNDSTKYNCHYYDYLNEGEMILWDLKHSEYGIVLPGKFIDRKKEMGNLK